MKQNVKTTGIYLLAYICAELSGWLEEAFNIVALYLYVKYISKLIRILRPVKTEIGVNFLLG
jgi:hypothetical protein